MNSGEQYRNREIDEKFNAVHAKLDSILTVASDTKDQAIKTNGRVNKLESWKSFMQGGLAIVTILLVPVLLLLIQIKLSK